MNTKNLLGVPPTLLPAEPEVIAALESSPVEKVVEQFPTSSLPWALLSFKSRLLGKTTEAYAYARVGYHRGLDALRQAGWKGQGPIPWQHEPNRGFLLSLYSLGRSAHFWAETDEEERITKFLDDADPTAVSEIESSSEYSISPTTEAIVIRGLD